MSFVMHLGTRIAAFAMLCLLTLLLPGWLHAEILVNKNFTPTTIDAGATATLGLIITNNVAATATGTNLADDMPPGILLLGPAISNSCQGTVTNASGNPIVSGDTSIRLVGGAVPPGSASAPVTCSLTFAVTNYSPNTSVINSIPAGSLTSSEGPNNDPASATLNTNPYAQLSGAKTVNPAFLHGGGTAAFTIVFTNSNLLSATFSVADTLPAGLSLTNVAGISNSCGSLVNTGGGALVDGDFGWRMFNGFLPPRVGANNGACTVTFTVQAASNIPATSGNANNSIPANFTNSLGVLTAAFNRNVSLQTGGAVTKSFVPNAVVVPGDAVLTINLANRNLQTITGAVVTDNLPPFVTINGTPSASASCGGSVNFTNNVGAPLVVGATSIRINSATIPPSDNSSQAAVGTCLVTVTVRLTAEGTYNNNIAAASFGAGLPSFSGSGNVPIVGIADISGTKTFVPATRVAGGTTLLVLSLRNNSAVGAASVAFTDNLRSMSTAGSFTVLATPAITNSCGGSVTNASTSFALSGGFLNAGANCQITVPVAISPTVAAGNYVNTLPAGTISSSIGTNTFAIAGTLAVVDPVAIAKVFAPTAVPPNTTALLTITITRRTANGAPNLTGMNLTDVMPTGITIANPNALFSNCGGVVTATPGGNTVTLAGGAITGVSGNCIIQASVLAASSATNTIPIGSLTTAEGFFNRTAPSAPISVGGQAPNFVLNKDFNPQSVKGGEASRMQITITNNAVGARALSSVSFNDVFPDNGGTTAFVIASPASPAVSGTGCTVGSYGAVLGSNTFSIAGAAVPAGGACSYFVNVVGYDTGTYNNQISASAVITAQGATNGNTAQKSLVISAAMTIGKNFNPSVISPGGASTLTIVILNTTNTQLTGTYPSFIDTLPLGVTVSAAPSTTCGSTTVVAPVGTRTVVVNSGVFPAGSDCRIFVPVTANLIGGYVNTIPSGTANFLKPVGTDTNAGTATAVLSVIDKPTVAKAFSPLSVAVNGTTAVTLTLTNPNNAVAVPGGLTGVFMTDTLPSGLSVAGNQVLGGSCNGVGSVNLADAATVVVLGPVGVNPSAACTVIFTVLVSSSGTKLNTSTGASSNQTGSAGTGSNVATLTVLVSPSISKSFTPTTMNPGDTVTMIIVASNPNAASLTLSSPAFSDNFPNIPAQMTLASVVASNSCGGTVLNSANTALALGNTGIRLNNGLIPPLSSCSVSVVVTAPSPGTYTNVTSVLSSTNAGNSTMTGAADLVVTQPSTALAITKTNALNSLGAGNTMAYTITVANLGPQGANNAVINDVATAGLVCTSVVCASVSGGAVCPPIGAAPFELSIDNLLVNGVKLPTFPALSQLTFVVQCSVTATGR